MSIRKWKIFFFFHWNRHRSQPVIFFCWRFPVKERKEENLRWRQKMYETRSNHQNDRIIFLFGYLVNAVSEWMKWMKCVNVRIKTIIIIDCMWYYIFFGVWFGLMLVTFFLLFLFLIYGCHKDDDDYVEINITYIIYDSIRFFLFLVFCFYTHQSINQSIDYSIKLLYLPQQNKTRMKKLWHTHIIENKQFS